MHDKENSATIYISSFSELQKQIFGLVKEHEPIHINQLAELCGIELPMLLQELTMLRVLGAVEESGSKQFVIRNA